MNADEQQAEHAREARALDSYTLDPSKIGSGPVPRDYFDPRAKQRLLMVGGPANGQWVEVENRRDEAVHHQIPPLGGRLPATSAEEVSYIVTRYKRIQTPGGHFMLCEGLTMNDAMALLLEGYRPGPCLRGYWQFNYGLLTGTKTEPGIMVDLRRNDVHDLMARGAKPFVTVIFETDPGCDRK